MRPATFLRVFATWTSLALSTCAASIDSPTVEHCPFYTGANTNSATCTTRFEFRCEGGCQKSFVEAQGCLPADNTGGNLTAPTTRTCDVEFSMVTPRINSCVSSTYGKFSCKGPSSGFATCSQCIRALHGCSDLVPLS
ncbi:hypothetical protein VP01_3338g6 [Puccinia sorghi]|uniref:Uncharacterized protein n=1 Tax=Puccinia sorghi TaxID=27349 RepID=A0A0L6UX43_9BASI|nr:hypothetical protein VP01_3338g6 [Puccinia sorghi]